LGVSTEWYTNFSEKDSPTLGWNGIFEAILFFQNIFAFVSKKIVSLHHLKNIKKECQYQHTYS
jgi:hypothetical protein